jgi:hypothetical protein
MRTDTKCAEVAIKNVTMQMLVLRGEIWRPSDCVTSATRHKRSQLPRGWGPHNPRTAACTGHLPWAIEGWQGPVHWCQVWEHHTGWVSRKRKEIYWYVLHSHCTKYVIVYKPTQNVTRLFHPTLLIPERTQLCVTVPRLSPFVLLVKATCRQTWICRIDGMILIGENQSTESTKNLTSTVLVLNPYKIM